MRLLVTGGSGFLGGYVLAEAARRGHACVALARSPAAARTVAARGAAPLAGDLDDGAALTGVFAGRAVRRAGQPGVARLRARSRRSSPRRSGPGSTGPCSSRPPRSPRRCPPAPRRCGWPPRHEIRCVRAELDDPAADDDLRRGRATGTCPGCSRCWRGCGAAPVPRACRCRCRCPAAAASCSSRSTWRTWPARCSRRWSARQAAGRCYDVAGPEPLTFAELLRASAAAVGGRVRLVPVPLAPVIALTRCYERLSRRPRIRAEQWQRLAEDKAFPIDAAARDLDYAPRPFAEGIQAEAAALGLRPESSPVPRVRQPKRPRGPSRPHPSGGTMPSLAKSPVAPVLGQHVPLRGPARLLFSSYARTRHEPDRSARSMTTEHGDVFDGQPVERPGMARCGRSAASSSTSPSCSACLVRPGDRCLDVGANIGLHTVRLARLVGRGGEVIAIEPDPGLARRIERNLVAQRPGQRPGRQCGRERPARGGDPVPPGPRDTNRARASLHAPLLPDRGDAIPSRR